MLLLGQLNFNQGLLCLLPPAVAAARGKKGRREQWEVRRVYGWWWTTQWSFIMPFHVATIICGFALPNAQEITVSIFSQHLLSFRCLVSTDCLDSCRLTDLIKSCSFYFAISFQYVTVTEFEANIAIKCWNLLSPVLLQQNDQHLQNTLVPFFLILFWT